jgi:hypothetical protein
MEAYSAPVGYVFSLSAGGRSGVFDVIAGDFSTELAADTENGVYVGLSSNPTATTKVAKRRYNDFVSVAYFGAVGDGATDDTDAIQAAIDYASPEGLNVFIPAGNYKIKNDGTARGVNIKSNVSVYGTGDKSELSAFSDNTSGFVIGASRTGITEVVKDFGLINVKVTGPSALAGGRVGSTVTVDWAENFVIDNVTAINGSDACIRITGYGDGAFTNDIASDFWNSTHRGIIRNCRVSNGYLGIEIEGGAEDILIENNKITDISSHGIRIPSGYNVRCLNNTVTGINGRGFWIDRHRDILIKGNYVNYTGTDAETLCIVFAGFDSTDSNDNGQTSKNVTIQNNTLLCAGSAAITDSYMGTYDKLTDGVIISGNFFDNTILLYYTDNFSISENTALSGGLIDAWNAISNGQVVNNKAPIEFNSAGYIKRAGNNGPVFFANNFAKNSAKPGRPLVQGGFVGTSDGIPTAGTWEAGHWVQNSEMTPQTEGGNVNFGWLCVVDGSPGTWVPIGGSYNQYSRRFTHQELGGPDTYRLLDFTVPHGLASAISVTIEGLQSRAPGGGVGSSKVFKHVITIVRNNIDVNTVIDDSLATNNFEVATTTAGGTASAGAVDVTARIVSGSTTEDQVVRIELDHAGGFLRTVATLEVISTSPLSTFGL